MSTYSGATEQIQTEPHTEYVHAVSVSYSTWWCEGSIPLGHAQQGHVADLDAVCQVELPQLAASRTLNDVAHTGVRDSVRDNPALGQHKVHIT